LNLGHPNRIFSGIIGKRHAGLCHEEIFCRVRGYLATCRKQGVSATQAMELVFEGRLPELAL
jgi:hypothetical protein